VTSADVRAWLRSFRDHPEARVRLVCLPHAGGSASFFLPLARALPSSVAVVAVQYPGRQDRFREPPIADVGELAGRIADALRAAPKLPTALFGHSMGAVVGFEVARRLEREAVLAPVALFASGSPAPSRVRPTRALHRASGDAIVEELVRLGGTHAELLESDELRRVFLQPVRADLEAIETYVHEPEPRLGCTVTALVGDRDPMTDVEEAAAWAECAEGRFAVHVFSGGHFYLQDDMQRVASVLEAELLKGACSSP
jgi:surfactin synthase thioesterase subunit